MEWLSTDNTRGSPMKPSFFLLNLALLLSWPSLGGQNGRGEVPPPDAVVALAQDLERRIVSTLSFSEVLEDYREDMVAFYKSAGGGIRGPMAGWSDEELGDFLLALSDWQLVCLSSIMTKSIFMSARWEDLRLRLPGTCRFVELLNDEYPLRDQDLVDAAVNAVNLLDPAIAEGMLAASSPYWTDSLYVANKEAIDDFTEVWIESVGSPPGGIDSPLYLIHILYFDVVVALVDGEPRVIYVNMHDT